METDLRIATAVEKHLRDMATDEYMAAYQREHGEFTPEEKKAARDIWDDAESLEADGVT